MKNLTKIAAGASALLMMSGCAYIGADRNADGTFLPNAELPDGDNENRVDSLKPRADENAAPNYSRSEEVRSDELLGGPDG